MNRIEYNALYDQACMALTAIEEETESATDEAYMALMHIVTMLYNAEFDQDGTDVVIITR